MAQYGDQFGRTDQYGEPVPQTDEYGRPVRIGQTTGTEEYGTHFISGGTAKEHLGGILHRSGSSSSSEDDGQGGRRKKDKGLKEKVMEKLPGGRKAHDRPHAGATTTPGGGYGYGEEQHEKKGIMDKIKEKLPGKH